VTPFPENVNIEVPLPVQLIPSVDVAIEFVPPPTATHIEPFHATPYPALENDGYVVGARFTHEIPSVDVDIVFVPEPPATNRDNCGLHAAPYPIVGIAVPPLPVHTIPSGDDAIGCVPY
jgi:hypothetical protein